MKRITIGLGREFDHTGRAIPEASAKGLKRALIAEATARFGGVTVINTEGAWRSPSGQMVKERGYTVQILVDGASDAFVEGRRFANYLVGLFDQSSVVFLVEDVQGFFINRL